MRTPEQMAEIQKEITETVLKLVKRHGLTPSEAVNALLMSGAELLFVHSTCADSIEAAFDLVQFTLDQQKDFAKTYKDSLN